jgi:glycosyltransferase involved in cell wall biosynthesis
MGQTYLWKQWKGHFNRIVSISATTQGHLARNGFGDVPVIPTGIRPHSQVRRLSLAPTVLFAGRLVREKGVAWLLQSFQIARRSVPDATLTILGEGPEAGPLKKLAAELDLTGSVRFPGWIPPEQMARDYGDSWVQVAPSVWEEPFGLVALEAGARATAMIVSDLGGLAEIVVDGVTGRKVPPHDVQGLAEALLETLSCRELAIRLGCQGRDHVTRNFSMDACLNRWCEVYDQIA